MKALKRYIVITILFISNLTFAQTYNNFYGDIVNSYSSDSVYNNLIEFENLGIKEPGTAALNNTLNWLINKYNNYGYTDIEIDTLNYGGFEVYNLIVTKLGTQFPTTYLIIDGHYDTKSGTGTNDNGSGTSIILETARLLKNVNTEYSIKFIHFTVEEAGLVGSSYYVNNTVIPQNMDIKLVFNIDEVGGVNGMTNNTIVCERDQSNPTLSNAASAACTDTLATCVSLYSSLLTEISFAYSSDYMPFQANENIITGLFEKNQSPHPHTPTDNIGNMDVNYVYEITQATIGASLYFAVAHQFDVGIESSTTISRIQVYPNPAKEQLTINLGNLPLENTTLQLINIVGEIVLEKTINYKIEQLDLKDISTGIYTLIISSPSFQITKKVVH
ncbi:MAG: M28 family peptidase [Flavobacteriales bacterium]|nr:M28 family peptidase [Flavobacteriales bacterium]